MRVLIDTNIILDLLLERYPFFEYSYEILNLCEKRKFEGFITAAQITDIFYIVRKFTKSIDIAYAAIGKVLEIVKVGSVGNEEVLLAYQKKAKDFEDCLIAQCSESLKCKYIITRNEKDFEDLGVAVISPEDYLTKIGKHKF